MVSIHTLVLALVLATPTIAQVVTCPSAAPTHIITIAGSTRAKPIANSWGAAYTAQCGAIVDVQGNGSNSGAKRVCGDTSTGSAVDIGAISCAWKTTEATKRAMMVSPTIVSLEQIKRLSRLMWPVTVL